MHFSLRQASPPGMTIRPSLPVMIMLLALACAPPVWAQKVTTVEKLTMEQTLVQLANPLGARPIGQSSDSPQRSKLRTRRSAHSSAGSCSS